MFLYFCQYHLDLYQLCRKLADDLGVVLLFEGLDLDFEGVGGVDWRDGDGFLKENFAGVDAGVDAMDGHAGDGFPGCEDGFMHGFSKKCWTGKFRNERRVHVDNWRVCGSEVLNEGWRENAHVADENDEIWMERVDRCDELCVELFACTGFVGLWVGLADVNGFVALLFCALEGVAVFFVTDDGGEFDARHGSNFHLVDDGLEIGAVG